MTGNDMLSFETIQDPRDNNNMYMVEFYFFIRNRE